MKKLVFAALATAIAFGAAAPAFAQEGSHEGRTAKKVVIHRDHGRHEGWRHRNVKKVVIHRDHGRHEGWRHSRHYGASKKVVIKHGNGKTVIKKRVEG
jgi:Ni/Co efflux regulator RcnB